MKKTTGHPTITTGPRRHAAPAQTHRAIDRPGGAASDATAEAQAAPGAAAAKSAAVIETTAPATARATRLFHTLQRAAHLLQLEADRQLIEAAGITTAQAAVLTLVAEAEGVTQREIAQQLGLHESALTAAVNRLERDGALVRGRHPQDARAWRLMLTPAGREAQQRGRERFASVNARIDDALEGRAAELQQGLARLVSAFAGASRATAAREKGVEPTADPEAPRLRAGKP